MFSDLMLLIVAFLIVMVIFTPAYINIFKSNMYNEWKAIWKNEIDAEKRKLAMQEVNATRKSGQRKQ